MISSITQSPNHLITLYDLGLMDYVEAWEFQKNLVRQVSEDQSKEALILVEHPRVLTRGRGFRGYTLGDTSLPIHDVERGGDVTYHGPGQWAGYPILNLKARNLLIGRYLRMLEEVLIEAVAPFGIEAQRQNAFTGVWAGGKKLASIGIAVQGWVTYHGFALNVNTDLSHFQTIYPCGLQPSMITSMRKILGKPQDMLAIKESLIQSFRKVFCSSITH